MASNKSGDESDRGSSAKNPPDDQTQHSKPSVLGRLIADVCYAFIEKREKDNREESRENKRFYFELATVIGVAVYSILTLCLVITQRDTEKRQLRAYVVVDQSSINVDANNNVAARVQFKNDGLTPAYKMTGWGCLAVEPFKTTGNAIGTVVDLPVPPYDPANAPKSIIGGSDIKVQVVFPFCSASTMVFRPLTVEERENIRNATAAIYMYGEVNYIDAFGVSRFVKYRVFTNDKFGLATGQTQDDLNGNDAN